MNFSRRNKICSTIVAESKQRCLNPDCIKNEKELSEWVNRINQWIEKMHCESKLKLDMKETLSELTSAMLEDIRLQEKVTQRLQPLTSRLLATSQKNLDEHSFILLDRTKLRDLDDGAIYGLTYLTQRVIHKQVVAISQDNTPIPILSISYQNLEEFCKEIGPRLTISIFLALLTYFTGKGNSDNIYG